jgi:hypothetical protein
MRGVCAAGRHEQDTGARRRGRWRGRDAARAGLVAGERPGARRVPAARRRQATAVLHGTARARLAASAERH